MIPMSWAGILGIFVGLFYLIASGDETKIQVLNEATQDLRRGAKRATSATSLADRERREMKPRPVKVLFVDDPDDLEFFEDQVEGKSQEARGMFQSWQEIRALRETLREEGLGLQYPDIIALADREVLLVNRLNQRLRNEER